MWYLRFWSNCAYKSEEISPVCPEIWWVLKHILIFSQKNTGNGSGLWVNKCHFAHWCIICYWWWMWHSLRGSLVVFPYITVEMELLAVLPAWRGQHAIPRLAGTAAVTHRTAKWRGRWLRGVAPGNIPSFLGLVKGQGWGGHPPSALIEGQASISFH